MLMIRRILEERGLLSHNSPRRELVSCRLAQLKTHISEMTLLC